MSDINLYLLDRDCPGFWDTYSGMVVAAENEDEAFKISTSVCRYEEGHPIDKYIEYVEWPRKEFIKIIPIGKADPGVEKGIVITERR